MQRRLPKHLHVVDFRARPLDLRPVVAAIMEAENWILERIPPDQKIVLLAGELHSNLTHSFLWQALIEAHATQQKEKPDRTFALGYEMPHDFFFKNGVEDKVREKNLLRALMDTPVTETIESIFKMCAHHGVSCSFNDISHYPEFSSWPSRSNVVDQGDPFTKSIVEKYRPDLLGSRIFRSTTLENFSSSDGMELSNRAIVDNAIAHIERTNARLYIQQCGRAHAVGSSEHECNFQTSLMARFEEAGFHVLPLLTSAEKDRNRSEFLHYTAKPRQAEFMRITGLQEFTQFMMLREDAKRQICKKSHMKLF